SGNRRFQRSVQSGAVMLPLEPDHGRSGKPALFYHVKRLQYHAKPERPDPVYAKKLQEVLGGAFGEITVMMQYLFQGGTAAAPPSTGICSLTSGPKRWAMSRCWPP